jgi:hypothetical protein
MLLHIYAAYSFILPFREAKFVVPRHVPFDKLRCAIGEKEDFPQTLVYTTSYFSGHLPWLCRYI